MWRGDVARDRGKGVSVGEKIKEKYDQCSSFLTAPIFLIQGWSPCWNHFCIWVSVSKLATDPTTPYLSSTEWQPLVKDPSSKQAYTQALSNPLFQNGDFQWGCDHSMTLACLPFYSFALASQQPAARSTFWPYIVSYINTIYLPPSPAWL